MSLLDGSQRLWQLTSLGISREKLGVRRLNGSQVWPGSVFPGQLLADTPSTGGRKKDGWKRGTVEQRQFGRRLKLFLLPIYFATLGAVPLPGLLQIMTYSVRLIMPTWATEILL